MIKKKIIIFIIAVIMTIIIIPVDKIIILAQEEQDYINEIINNSIIIRVGSPKALVNGEIKYIDTNRNIVPFIDENNRTLVPVRFISEKLNWQVDYDEQNKQITLSQTMFRPIIMNIDSNIFVYDNQKHFVDSTPVLYQDRTFIPLRAFVEMALKMNILYVNSERIIIISDIINIDSKSAKNAADKITDKLPVWLLDMDKVQIEWKNWPQYENNENDTDDTDVENGENEEEYHSGTDFAVPLGSNVYSVYSGTVDTVADMGDEKYGKYVIIKSIINNKDRYMYYAHLDEFSVSIKEGDKIYAGYIIGKSGNSGNSEGPHLHYEVRNEYKSYGSIDNPTLNPYDYLP
ncbi:MAG: peptidoglycan DD-metalloendopeptidase family protein [Oscillospiraceae bacterium]|nr:peptidoglycan DD-metalloendopeptidase family protein [Oscillospiraceae bacterium]